MDDVSCIGSLEHHIHQLFSHVRVPGEDFVYSASSEMFNLLDEYCEESSFHEPRPPLLLVDETGSGKSALLSNWLFKRNQRLTQTKKTSHVTNDFTFWHAVGCSRQSMNVNSMIRRLMSDLKTKFDITRDIPMAPDRLSWELPRFLEMAAKKGKLVIVIDGIHRLVNNDDKEAPLAWLPLEFPPNVRMIVSATRPANYKKLRALELGSLASLSDTQSHLGDGSIGGQSNDSVGGGVSIDDNLSQIASPRSVKGLKILAELERRKWKSHIVRPMDKAQCRDVVRTYISKSIQSDMTSLTTGPFLTAMPYGDGQEGPIDALDSTLGFLLFDTQIGMLLSHPEGNTPLFLRVFLTGAHYAVGRGFSLWYLFDTWMKADSVSALCTLILTTMEKGYSPSQEDIESDRQRTIEAGGVAALKELYKDHPSFKDSTMDETDDITLLAAAETNSTQKANPQASHNDDNLLSEQVKENLGDHHWLALGGFADSVLERTRKQINDSIRESLANSAGLVEETFGQSALGSDRVSSKNPLNFVDMAIKFEEEKRATMGTARMQSKMKTLTEEEASLKPTDIDTTSANAAALSATGEFMLDRADSNFTLTSKEEQTQKFSTDMDMIPQYLLGGSPVTGMGSILGNALALLYVARHGLKESEIWGMLFALRRVELREAELNSNPEDVRKQLSEAKAVIEVCYEARGMLQDLLRAEDLAHSGTITQVQLYGVMKKLHPGLLPADAIKIMEVCQIPIEVNSILAETHFINYNDLLQGIVRVNAMKDDPALVDGRDEASTNNDDFTYNTLDDGSITSLGAVMEESLLALLIAIGVLHSPDNHVLMLPSDNDSLRSVVYRDYVEGRGGKKVWHGHLIKHFQKQENNMRRCEELPWHLQLCRKWHSVKEVLVDLDTFEMMYDSSDLRDEFMAYWAILTEGPMFINDEAHENFTTTRQKQIEEALRAGERKDPELTVILMELDMATALGLSEKATRAMLLQDQVSPFDIIEEFNASVQAWVNKIRPPVSLINGKLLHIARFLAEFSSKVKTQPPFLRLTFDTKVLSLFGVNFDILKELDTDMGKQEDGAPGGSLTEMLAGGSIGDDDAKEKEVFPNKQQLSGNYYLYLRWMWTMLPWLAMDKTLQVGSICEVGGLASVLAAVAAGKDKALITTESSLEGDTSLVEDTNKTGRNGKQNASVARSTRLWDTKKNDPSQPLFLTTSSRKNAFVNSSMVPARVSDVMDNNLRKVRDDIANAASAKNKLPPKFRRTLAQEEEALKGIPHAHHCRRSVSSGTLFPTLDASIKEKNKAIQADDERYETALMAMRRGGPGLPLENGLDGILKEMAEADQMKQWNDKRGGALPIGSEKELEYEREFERMVKLRGLANKMTTLFRQRKSIATDLKQKVEARDIQDEETAYLMLSGEAAIEQLKEKFLNMTNALDEGYRLNNGYKLLIEMLQYNPPFTERHVSGIQQQVALAKAQLSELKKLRHKMYLQAEKDAHEKKRQIQNKITYFKESRSRLKKKKMSLFPELFAEKLSRTPFASSKDGKGEVNVGGDEVTLKSGVSDSLNQDSLSVGSLASTKEEEEGQTKAENADGEEKEEDQYKNETAKERIKRLKYERETKVVAPEVYKFDKESLVNNTLQLMFQSFAANRKELDLKASQVQAKMVYDFLMEKTRSTSDEELVDRFLSGKKLTETLQGQQIQVDSRLAQLRAEYDDLKNGGLQNAMSSVLTDTETEGESGNQDVRFLENKLFEQEMHLNQTRREVELAVNKINEVRTGVSHLMSLISVNHKLLHSLPRSKAPSLSSPDEIATCLSWCEERILAVNEAALVDNPKPKATTNQEDSKTLSLSDRQTELADTIQSMIKNKDVNQSTVNPALLKKTKRMPGNMAELLMNTGEGLGSQVNHAKEVLVQVSGPKNDKLVEREVELLQRRRDKEAERFEIRQRETKHGDVAGVHKFLTEALSSKDAQELLRKTNLAAGHTGRDTGYGYVLDDFLTSQGLKTGPQKGDEDQ